MLDTIPRTGDEGLPSPDSTGAVQVEARVAALLEVAAGFSTGVPVDELTSLLPATGPATPSELVDWLGARPHLARLVEGRAYPPHGTVRDPDGRHARAVLYEAEARRLVEEDLAGVLPMVRYVGVTGSTAYGEPDAGDDLDLFVVTETGALWVFLAYAYLRTRAGRMHPWESEPRPGPCFNYLLDEREAHHEFTRPQGFLFAREALVARAVVGQGFYRSLLGRAAWMEREIPRLYRARAQSAPDLPPRAAPWPIRAMNLILFPLMATYLQLAGLKRNARLRRQGLLEKEYRTDTRPGHVAFSSERFARMNSRLSRSA